MYKYTYIYIIYIIRRTPLREHLQEVYDVKDVWRDSCDNYSYHRNNIVTMDTRRI